ncbi:MAG: type I-C CRISPR-associated protein Cas5c [Proteobacteria bacterium]|nr:type I-C CRISPR-associated protein Cas5c [Pseudomonadota bacterium]
MNTPNLINIRVWGDYACFTRPEMKVERVSYPVCTPSAARGILEAIYWEPQMYYVIDSITVIKKGRWFNFRRNEITSIISLKETQSWMAGRTSVKYISAGGGAPDAAQRNMLGLADVEYIITAEARTTRLHDATRFNLKKYLEEIERRASKGKCYHRPAFGCREFTADFEWVQDVQETLGKRAAEVRADKEDKDWKKIWIEEDLGLMLYDVFDVDQREDGFRWFMEQELKSILLEQKPEHLRTKKSTPSDSTIKYFEGTAITPRASFFHAKIKDSRMDCHPDRVKIIPTREKEVI